MSKKLIKSVAKTAKNSKSPNDFIAGASFIIEAIANALLTAEKGLKQVKKAAKDKPAKKPKKLKTKKKAK